MHPTSINGRLRPSILATPVANLLRVTFPNAGMYSSTTNLGIAWANPANHNQLLGPLNGLDFQNGSTYLSTNLRNLEFQDLLIPYTLSIIVVDASGTDMYTIGATTSSQNAQLQRFSTLSVAINAGSTPGAGLRGQLTINQTSGAITVLIPAPIVFYGG
jgi:hypothetical protein